MNEVDLLNSMVAFLVAYTTQKIWDNYGERIIWS